MKKIIALLGAFTLAFSSVSLPFFIGNENIVSALSSSVEFAFPDTWFNTGINQSLCDDYLDELKSNPNFSEFEDCYVLFNGVGGSSISVFIISPTSQFTWDDGVNRYFWIGKFSTFSCDVSQLGSYSFNVYELDSVPAVPNITPNCLMTYPFNGSVGFGVGTCNLYNNFPVMGTYVYYNCFYHVDNTIPPYQPDYSGPLYGFPVGLEFSTADFMKWLVDNDKIAVSVDSGGASVGGKIPAYIGTSKLLSFLEFYKQFGSSNASFISRIGGWFSYMNIVNQTNDNIVILKNTIDALYREYINSYRVEIYPSNIEHAHHRRNVNTQTTDDDLTLVTDDANDDIYTTLLREIIRGIVALQSTTVSNSRAIIDAIDNLDFSVNVANNGGEYPVIDLSSLYTYDSDSFSDDLQTFEANIEEVQNVPQGYIDTINQNSLMPENMLEDKNSLTVNVPTITGFTVGGNGSTYSTQTGSYVLRSVDYPWLDSSVQKIKRFASVILILGYLVHLRYRIPELIRGE